MSSETGRDPDARAQKFLEQFGRHQDRVFAYVFSLLPHRADAEDVFQRTSLTIWRKLDQWDERGSFLTWAFGIAFYEVRNFVRTAGRDRHWFSDELLARLAEERPAALEGADERGAALLDCLQRLDDAERRLLDRAYDGAGNLKQLAAETGQAVQTIYNKLSLLRRRLLRCVDLRLGRPEVP